MKSSQVSIGVLFVSIACVTLSIMVGPAFAAKRNQTTINQVAVNYDLNSLVISGSAFTPKRQSRLMVALGDPASGLGDITDNCTLDAAASPQTIECILTNGLPPDGDYLLTVSFGKRNAQNDEYDLTIDSVGRGADSGPRVVDLQVDCNADAEGRFRWDGALLEFCTGDGWAEVQLGTPKKCCNPLDEPGVNGNPICFEGHACCPNTGTWACSIGDGKTFPCGDELVVLPQGKACIDPPTRFCTADVKECPDGSFVARDENNNCEFFPCPPDCSLVLCVQPNCNPGEVAVVPPGECCPVCTLE